VLVPCSTSSSTAEGSSEAPGTWSETKIGWLVDDVRTLGVLSCGTYPDTLGRVSQKFQIGCETVVPVLVLLLLVPVLVLESHRKWKHSHRSILLYTHTGI
jgi:hypothetical protein